MLAYADEKTGIINAKSKLVACALFLAFVFNSCYTVNERTYLNVVFNDSKLSAVYLNKYIDSVRNKGMIVPDSIKYIFFTGDEMRDNQRLIYFGGKPQEWYLINFDATPCWIESIYNPALAGYKIHDKLFISATELTRIKKRFEAEVLNEAEDYGKAHHVADTVLYR